MRNVLWIGAALILAAVLFLLVYKNNEPASAVNGEAIVVEDSVEAPDSTAESDAANEAEAETIDATSQVVEESASEPEPEEQAILLAQANTPAPQEWQYKEGEHYSRMVPTQPTVGGADKIEVAEFFWYGCSHCFDFEPYINGWSADKPANVRFVRIPAMWNRVLKLHARLFYTEQVLVRNGVIKDAAGFRNAVFEEYHRRSNRLTSEAAIQKLFERHDVSAAEFERTWKSFEVDQKLRVAEDLARRYGVSNVPAIVVNGKYVTGGTQAGSYTRLLEVIDELIARESAR